MPVSCSANKTDSSCLMAVQFCSNSAIQVVWDRSKKKGSGCVYVSPSTNENHNCWLSVCWGMGFVLLVVVIGSDIENCEGALVVGQRVGRYGR